MWQYGHDGNFHCYCVAYTVANVKYVLKCNLQNIILFKCYQYIKNNLTIVHNPVTDIIAKMQHKKYTGSHAPYINVCH